MVNSRINTPNSEMLKSLASTMLTTCGFLFVVELCEIPDICEFLQQTFTLTCFGNCSQSNPFDEPKHVEGLFNECDRELQITFG